MNKKELILYPLFSMPVIAVDVNIDNKKILKFLKKTKLGIQPHGINSYMSHSVKILDDKIMVKEKNNLLKVISTSFKQVLNYKKQLKILNSWVTKTGVNGESQNHVHRNSWMSGVYYPEHDKNFQIIFKKEPMSCSTYDVFENNHNIYSCEEWTITPKENTVLLFPSNLMHRVAKNLSNKNRYSLAFNINPIGTFYKNCDTEITYE
tara:strand:- start:1477 stop:2094 length:618 start_codon:yes stop_codon:yes gene_type:complete